MFWDFAETVTVVPLFSPFIVHEVLVFLAVQDFLPTEILVALIGAPPLSAPKATVTVKLTIPFLTGELVIEVISGALGFETDFTAALAGAVKVATRIKGRIAAKRFMLQEYNALINPDT